MSEGVERVQFSGKVDDKGHVHPDSGTVRETAWRLAKFSGKRVTVTVSRYVKSKSNSQLALFHGPVLEAWSEHCGYDPADMKRELKLAFLAPALAISKLTGEEKEYLPSLADLTSDEMSTFLERVLREGRQMGITFSLDQSG